MVFEANKSFPPLKNKRKFGGKRKNYIEINFEKVFQTFFSEREI
jgi:hypothetical protein